MIYKADNFDDAVALIEEYGIKYVFETTYDWPRATLEEFSPCLLVDAEVAGELFDDGLLVRYESYAYDVREDY